MTMISFPSPSRAAFALLLLFAVVAFVTNNDKQEGRNHRRYLVGSRRLQFNGLDPSTIGDSLGIDLGSLSGSLSDFFGGIFGNNNGNAGGNNGGGNLGNFNADDLLNGISNFTDAFREIFCSIPGIAKCADNNNNNNNTAQPSPQCPVVKPLGTNKFDLDRYTEFSWFIQQQQVTPYQSKSSLYCVTATYDIDDNGDVQVSNYGNQNKVNGTAVGAGTLDLCARQNVGGKLAVGPCIVPERVFDVVAVPYWVIALDQQNYSWAMVSAGAPDVVRKTIENNDGTNTTLCSTKVSTNVLDTTRSGLWLITRQQVAAPQTISMMKSMLTDMGVFTGDLLPVQQKGCGYKGATLKAAPKS